MENNNTQEITNKKGKPLKVIIAFTLLAVVIVFAGGIFDTASKVLNNQIDVYINVQVDGKTLLKEKIRTNKEDFKSIVKEGSDDLKFITQNSAYGIFVEGIKVNDKKYMQNPSAGKYWVYESNNNKTCVKDKMCPSISDLKVADNDEFVFKLEKYE